ncbi:uncharacterized protein LOC114738708 [Neltuma alba]|uniref:uncharacterized protein LOC114738708 n=1 Tax=Neltuma alba TaxID=207710 RepID=UPI0010A33891|nr:uncharacterized protein LOC114738708 [Prosopis alba]
MDMTTLKRKKGQFARLCVELDLSAPLRSLILINGKAKRVQYEERHKRAKPMLGGEMAEELAKKDGGRGAMEEGQQGENLSEEVAGKIYDNWMVVQRPRRPTRFAHRMVTLNEGRRDSRLQGGSGSRFQALNVEQNKGVNGGSQQVSEKSPLGNISNLVPNIPFQRQGLEKGLSGGLNKGKMSGPMRKSMGNEIKAKEVNNKGERSNGRSKSQEVESSDIDILMRAKERLGLENEVKREGEQENGMDLPVRKIIEGESSESRNGNTRTPKPGGTVMVEDVETAGNPIDPGAMQAGNFFVHSNLLSADQSVWNSRGVGGKAFPRLLNELPRKYDAKFIAILEPRQGRAKAESLARRMGKTSAWDLSIVYGHPNRIKRRSLWEELQHIHATGVGKWCVAGDFNATLRGNERVPTNKGLNGADKSFVDWVRGCYLNEVDFQGPRFTWSRGNSYSRIDRVLANSEWFETFIDASVLHLPKLKSDHCPLLVKMNRQRRSRGKTNHFRFFAPWVTHEGFNDVVKNAWRSSNSWEANVGNFKEDVLEWNRSVFGNINRRKAGLLAKLDRLNKMLKAPFWSENGRKLGKI